MEQKNNFKLICFIIIAILLISNVATVLYFQQKIKEAENEISILKRIREIGPPPEPGDRLQNRLQNRAQDQQDQYYESEPVPQ